MSFTRLFNVISYATRTIRQSTPIVVLSKIWNTKQPRN
nr:MAG TPA: hypothetical protein [Caudoviricetes sp.]